MKGAFLWQGVFLGGMPLIRAAFHALAVRVLSKGSMFGAKKRLAGSIKFPDIVFAKRVTSSSPDQSAEHDCGGMTAFRKRVL